MMEETPSDPIAYANLLQEQLDYLVYDEKYELDPAHLKLLDVRIHLSLSKLSQEG